MAAVTELIKRGANVHVPDKVRLFFHRIDLNIDSVAKDKRAWIDLSPRNR